MIAGGAFAQSGFLPGTVLQSIIIKGANTGSGYFSLDKNSLDTSKASYNEKVYGPTLMSSLASLSPVYSEHTFKGLFSNYPDHISYPVSADKPDHVSVQFDASGLSSGGCKVTYAIDTLILLGLQQRQTLVQIVLPICRVLPLSFNLGCQVIKQHG